MKNISSSSPSGTVMVAKPHPSSVPTIVLALFITNLLVFFLFYLLCKVFVIPIPLSPLPPLLSASSTAKQTFQHFSTYKYLCV